MQRQNQILRCKAEGLQRNPLQNVWTIPWGGIDSDTELYVNSRCRRRGRAPKNSPPWGLGIYAIFRKYEDSDAVCAPCVLPTLSLTTTLMRRPAACLEEGRRRPKRQEIRRGSETNGSDCFDELRGLCSTSGMVTGQPQIG